jgi:hypothetical protein
MGMKKRLGVVEGRRVHMKHTEMSKKDSLLYVGNGKVEDMLW